MSLAHCAKICMLSLAVLVVSAPELRAAEGPARQESAVLYMTDGDFYAGDLQDIAGAGTVSWQCAGSIRPFEFPVTAIRAAYFPLPEKPSPAQADFCFELTDGDRLFGNLVALTPETVEIESNNYGRLRVSRAHIRRIHPWKGAAAWEYSGPNSLAEWRRTPERNAWIEEAGHLHTSAPAAKLRKQILLPARAAIELAISWNKKADFILALAAGADKRLEGEGIHFEVWDDKLVLVRETREDADLATVCDLKTASKRVHFQVFVDQEKGTVAVHALDGKLLAEISVGAAKEMPLKHISLLNHRGDVRLEQIIVSKWSGQLPPQVDVKRERVQKSDGAVLYGDIVSYDQKSRTFTLNSDEGEQSVSLDEVAHVAFWSDASVPAGGVRIGCHDGSRLSGQLTKVEGDKLFIQRAGIDEPVVFPIADVRCLLGAAVNERSVDLKQFGRLEIEGVRSHGALVDGNSDEAASCLVWKPRQSTTSSPLAHAVKGSIVYRDVKPAPKLSAAEQQRQQQVQQQRNAQQGVWGAFINAFSGPPAAAPTPRMSGYPHAVFLLAGDRIPCIVSRIDDEGVYFSSSVVEKGMVPHAQIKALELVPYTAAASLAEEKRTRLLTLPRMQKNNPPTHLIASTTGDVLRGRIDAMDVQTLYVETRLETKRLPRGRISTIIWLHPAVEDQDAAAGPDTPLDAIRVQAVRGDGVRLTFVPHEFAKNALIGNSDLLGACRVEINSVDRILLGAEERQDDAAFADWELTDAIEPKFVREGDAPIAPTAGLNSSLIGKPAPEIRLEKLGGGNFTLSEHKGSIVVLDFWATWCAPCIQAMPELERVVGEFKDEKVEYVAVNMQEDSATIAATLERLQLGPTVALDIDGAAAGHYEVSAIPQVVIVDADGNVARMFVGVNADFADQLRDALNRLLNPSDSAAKNAASQHAASDDAGGQ